MSCLPASCPCCNTGTPSSSAFKLSLPACTVVAHPRPTPSTQNPPPYRFQLTCPLQQVRTVQQPKALHRRQLQQGLVAGAAAGRRRFHVFVRPASMHAGRMNQAALQKRGIFNRKGMETKSPVRAVESE